MGTLVPDHNLIQEINEQFFEKSRKIFWRIFDAARL